jgi:tetratricopeptide (TPR) repeat protein
MFTGQWTRERAALLAVFSLMAGIAGGWLIGGLRHPVEARATKPAVISAPAATASQPGPRASNPEQMKEKADAQAAPLVDQLKSQPNDPALLTSIGNLYYDAQQYPVAVDYYDRALKAKPSDAAVRTDMATAYWYMGNSDSAIAEFNKALTYAPNNPNTLFNRGLVKWQGKRDAAGAAADWEKLLATAPNYPEKDNVQQMLNQVRAQQAATAGLNAK